MSENLCHNGRHIYLAAFDDAVKIGMARDVNKRLSQISSSSGRQLRISRSTPCIGNASEIEAAVKAQFSTARLGGEWFGIDVLDEMWAAIHSHEFRHPESISHAGVDELFEKMVGRPVRQEIEAHRRCVDELASLRGDMRTLRDHLIAGLPEPQKPRNNSWLVRSHQRRQRRGRYLSAMGV